MKIQKIKVEKCFVPIEVKLIIETQEELDIFNVLGGHNVSSAEQLKELNFYNAFDRFAISKLLANFYKLDQ